MKILILITTLSLLFYSCKVEKNVKPIRKKYTKYSNFCKK